MALTLKDRSHVSSDGHKSGRVDSDWAFDDASDQAADICSGAEPVKAWVVQWIADHSEDLHSDLLQNYFDGDEPEGVLRTLSQEWIAGFAAGLEERIRKAMRDDWCVM